MFDACIDRFFFLSSLGRKEHVGLNEVGDLVKDFFCLLFNVTWLKESLS